MESNPTPQCHHIKTSGVRCASPALRNRRYCYFHQRARPLLIDVAARQQDPALFSLPPLEDAHAIQHALRNVAHRLLDRTLDTKTAGLLLYALQIASSNLKQMKTETPQPEQVVVDLPQLSEISRPRPIPETLRHISYAEWCTHFPDTPSPQDEYQDDIQRQAREVRETLAPQIHDDEDESTARNQTSAVKSQTPEADQSAGENGGLRPGTIQACVHREKRGSRPRYVI